MITVRNFKPYCKVDNVLGHKNCLKASDENCWVNQMLGYKSCSKALDEMLKNENTFGLAIVARDGENSLCELYEYSPNATIIYRTNIFGYTICEISILFIISFIIFLITLSVFSSLLKKKFQRI